MHKARIEQIDAARRVIESRVSMRLRLARGAAWAGTVERLLAVFPGLLDELCTRAKRDDGEIIADVTLFQRWQRGEFVPLDLDKRIIAINLEEHVLLTERCAREDGLEEPAACACRD